MDYSKLSDFEIDKAVADALGLDYDIAIMFVSPVDKIKGNHVEEYVRKKITSNEKHWKRFSPTRIPNDAWPIISGHNISIMYVEALSKWCAGSPYWVDGCEWQLDIDVVDENPLRAAMILFLMMQEAK